MTTRFRIATSAFALGAASIAAPAFAQSTGSIDFENEEIVVTGTRQGEQNVGGIAAPDSPKTRVVLTQEFISRQNPGQSILDTINAIPGVNFQNNDAYGSAGGTLNIRGFSSDRISLTFDGIPLNDSGNYAIFSNQQLDPEVIEQVNVNLGSTDIDSPTASAVGGTVNYRTLVPTRDFGVRMALSAGEYDFMRGFVLVNTGEFTSIGTRAFFSASRATNSVPFNGYGQINKQQYNARIYQPLGGDDFISIAGHYNQNRNNFFGSLPLRNDTTRVQGGVTVPRIVGPNGNNRYPANRDERFYNINYPCLLAGATPGVADGIAAAPASGDSASCATEFDRRYNPSNTGNIRGSSRFHLTDNLILTVDPSYQYVKANGGGTVTAQEGAVRDINPAGGTATTAACRTTPSSATNTCVAGYLGGVPYFGRDLNGDGDTLDSVLVLAPSQTQTHRVGVISSLRYDLNEHNSFRLTYTYDRARHRQTGEVGLLQPNGEPYDVFPVNSPVSDINGVVQQKRDRLSFAILHQVSAEYRGEFFDERLTVNIGVRAPFFRRNLSNFCFTSSAGGFVECFGRGAALNATYQTLNPYTYTVTPATGTTPAITTITGAAPPQQRVFDYNKVLPNIGFTFDISDHAAIYGSFAQGLSVPGTDSLYNAFFFPLNTARARPAPETTDSFEAGFRYRSNQVQAQVSAWYTQYQNRLASAYDPELDQQVFRNLGNVRKYGIEGSISYSPIPQLTAYIFADYNKSEIRDNIAVGENANGTTVFAATAGQRESGSPEYSYGGTLRTNLGPLELGLTAKRTGGRYIFDTNQPTFTGTYTPPGAVPSGTAGTAAATQIYPAQAPAYWLVNANARLSLAFLGLNDESFVQLNVYNLFDQFYVGGFGGGLFQSATYNRTTGLATYGNPGFVQIGAPRTISGTVNFAF